MRWPEDGKFLFEPGTLQNLAQNNEQPFIFSEIAPFQKNCLEMLTPKVYALPKSLKITLRDLTLFGPQGGTEGK